MEQRLDPRKRPVQRRSQSTCAAILEATARILETGGGKALTTNRVAERAGVSVGSLYQYFPSKEAIVAELIRRMRQEMLADFEAAARRTADSTLAEAADALIEASLRHHLRRPALAQALEREEEHLTLDTETRALKAGMHALLVEVLERHGVADVERTAFDLSALSRGMIEAALRAGQSDLDELRRRILRAILGYLGLPHPRAAPTGLAADR